METDKLMGALGLCRRAGALTVGFDAVKDAVLSGRAHLVLYTQDASEGNVRRIQWMCGEVGDDCPVCRLPLTKQDLAAILHKAVGVLAVTDENLAVLCRAKLPNGGN
jgi:ribosomal protein L7Ae-like RNA K-turn-binding protein